MTYRAASSSADCADGSADKDPEADGAEEVAALISRRSVTALGDHRGLYRSNAWRLGLADKGRAHRLQEKQGHESRDDIQRCRYHEDRVPAPSRRVNNAGERYDQSRRPFSGVEQAGVRRGVFGPEGVTAGRGKQTVNFAPGKEHEPCQDDEQ